MQNQELQDPEAAGPGNARRSCLGSMAIEATKLEGSGLSAWEFLEILQSSQKGLIPDSYKRKPS